MPNFVLIAIKICFFIQTTSDLTDTPIELIKYNICVRGGGGGRWPMAGCARYAFKFNTATAEREMRCARDTEYRTIPKQKNRKVPRAQSPSNCTPEECEKIKRLGRPVARFSRGNV